MVVGRPVKAKLKTRVKCNLEATANIVIDKNVSYELWWMTRVLLRNYIYQTIGRAVLWRSGRQ